MKRIANFLGLALGAALSLSLIFSCTKETPLTKGKITLANEEDLNVELSSLKEITFNSTLPWTAALSEAGAGWLTVSPTSGDSGEGTIRLTAKPNAEAEARTAEIVLSQVNGTGTLTINVVQSSKDMITLVKESVDLDFEAQTFEMQVLANVDYEVIIPDDCDWISFEPIPEVKGMDRSSVKFYVSRNEGYGSRYEDLKIAKKNPLPGETPIEFHVYQDSTNEMIKLAQIEFIPTSCATYMSNTTYYKEIEVNGDAACSVVFNVYGNCDFTMDLEVDALKAENRPAGTPDSYKWISVEKKERPGSKNDYDYKVTFQPNAVPDIASPIQRTATFEFISPSGLRNTTFKMVQRPVLPVE